MRDYIEHLKGKPEPVRRQYALGASAGIASLVFLGWAAALVSSGTLALDSASERVPARSFDSSNAGLAGAAAAFSSAVNGEGSLTAVDTNASSTLDQQDTGDATVIPF